MLFTVKLCRIESDQIYNTILPATAQIQRLFIDSPSHFGVQKLTQKKHMALVWYELQFFFYLSQHQTNLTQSGFKWFFIFMATLDTFVNFHSGRSNHISKFKANLAIDHVVPINLKFIMVDSERQIGVDERTLRCSFFFLSLT